MTRTWRDVVLAVLTVQFGFVGLWAVTAPRSFYDSFPGAGRTWVSVDGSFNEHLVRDVGGLFAAIAAVCAYALVTRSPWAVRSAGVAVAVFSLPHTIYHVATVDLLPVGDGIANVVTLSLGLALGVALIVSPAPAGSATLRGRLAEENPPRGRRRSVAL